jgi:hypothetical protein
VNQQQQRICEARRAGHVARFGHLMGAERAEAAMAAWEAKAETLGIARDSREFWDGAEAWMTAGDARSVAMRSAGLSEPGAARA